MAGTMFRSLLSFQHLEQCLSFLCLMSPISVEKSMSKTNEEDKRWMQWVGIDSATTQGGPNLTSSQFIGEMRQIVLFAFLS